MNLKNRIHPTIFAYRWNAAPDFTTACRMLRMKPKSATMRAAQYRERHGIPLQKFQEKRPEVNWNDVRKAAIKGTRRRKA